MKAYLSVCVLFRAGYGLAGWTCAAQAEAARYNVDPEHSAIDSGSRRWSFPRPPATSTIIPGSSKWIRRRRP